MRKNCAILSIFVLSLLSANTQNTLYYNKYKHWSPDLVMNADTDAQAIVSLGSCYDRGDGVTRNTEKAFELFKKAAEKNDFLGLYNLGYYYFKGISTEVDYVEAERNMLEAIKLNPKLTPAYQVLAYMYDKGGSGFEINRAKAFEMYSHASELGDYISTYYMASYYRNGFASGSPDYIKSLECYLKVKDYWEKNIQPAGLVAHQIAGFYLNGYGMDVDLDMAIKYLEESVNLGFYEAYDNLASAYHKQGLYEKCFESLSKGYEHGVMRVCNNLGDSYYYGRGTVQSYQKAYLAFERGADYSPLCKFRQSEMLRNGEGVQTNTERANTLLIESADSGLDRAQYRLGTIYYDGIVLPRNYDKAVELLEKALEGKYMIDDAKSDIYRKLSICYRFGRGVEANLNKANEYNAIAASLGDSNARKIEEWLHGN